MKLILLSGGSGKRLWPLSNESRSKQFLKVLRREDGRLESMVQRVWRQMERSGMAAHAYVATSASQAEMVRSQLGGVPVVLEPQRRDTFPAIALAAVYLHSAAGVPLDETVAVLPVDPYVEDRFFEEIGRLEDVLEASGAPLVLMGVKPTHPSEKYGYIVPRRSGEEDGQGGWLEVERFAEKPEEARAAELIDRGALWNCGVFAFRLGYLIRWLAERDVPLRYEELAQQYERMPKISFDYEVVEKTSRIAAVEYDGYWKDLGTWNTLTEEMAEGVLGRGAVGGDCRNTHVVNELDIPVVVLGLSDVVVSASPDGILVADKQASPKVKELTAQWDDRPMCEERRWGSFRILDCKQHDDGYQSLVKRVHIDAGQHLSYHYHASRSETWTILSGEGELVLEGSWRRVRPGDTVHIPAYARHSLFATTDLELVEVQSGTELTDADVCRLAFRWQDILALCG